MKRLNRAQECGNGSRSSSSTGSNNNATTDPLYQQFGSLKQEWESYKRTHCLFTHIHQLMIRPSSPTRLMSWLQQPSPSPCKWVIRRRCDWAAREIVNERLDAIEGGRIKGIRRLFSNGEQDVEEEEEETCITDITEWSDYYLSSVDSGSTTVVDGGLLMSPGLSCMEKDNRAIEGLHEEVKRDDNGMEVGKKMVIAVRYRHSMARKWTLMKWITLALIVFAWILGIANVVFGVHWKWIEGREVIHLVPT